MDLTSIQIAFLIGAAIIIGFSKTGITGATLPAIVIIAYIFGGKTSSGIMLPMLILGDLFAVYSYGKFGKAKDVLKVLPPALFGIFLGAVVGNFLNDAQFKILMGVIVILCLILLIYKEFKSSTIQIPDNRLFHGIVGIISGFSSMVGNAAGPIFSVYLLSLSFEKNKFMGTTSWFFFVVNIIKVPFHIILWKTITFDTLKYTIYLIPFIIIGAILGVLLVKKINEKQFRLFVILATAISAIRLII